MGICRHQQSHQWNALLVSRQIRQHVLSNFPGLAATFWLLALSELLALGLGVLALARGEFLERKRLALFPAMLAWSLFVFVQLGFGQWLTNAFNEAFQQFMYFSGTLLALHFVMSSQSVSSQ